VTPDLSVVDEVNLQAAETPPRLVQHAGPQQEIQLQEDRKPELQQHDYEGEGEDAHAATRKAREADETRSATRTPRCQRIWPTSQTPTPTQASYPFLTLSPLSYLLQ